MAGGIEASYVYHSTLVGYLLSSGSPRTHVITKISYSYCDITNAYHGNLINMWQYITGYIKSNVGCCHVNSAYHLHHTEVY